MSRSTPYPPEIRYTAEMLYVIERRTKPQVVEMTGISASTFDRWRRDGNWDEKRGLEVISIPYLVKEMKEDIARTYARARREDRPLTPGERDGVHKTVLNMQKLDKGALFASHGIQIMDLFSAFLAEQADELRESLVPFMVEFTQKLAKQYV